VAILPAAHLVAATTAETLQAPEADIRLAVLLAAATTVPAPAATTHQVAPQEAATLPEVLPVEAIAAEVPQEEAVTAALHIVQAALHTAVPPTAAADLPIAAVDTDNKALTN